MEFNLETALREIAQSDLVSFDVFDTALLRKVDRPTDVFLAMTAPAAKIIGQETPSFFECRLKAEIAAKSIAARDRRQITLKDIYAEFPSECPLTDEQRQALQQLEVTTEKNYVYGNPLVLSLYHHAIDLKKTIIFLSDMYLPSDCIRQFLEHHGYASPTVFVSSEWGGNKGSGQLYKIVQKQLKTPAKRCLHFGDNFYADVVRAKLSGWQAIHTPLRKQRFDSKRPPSNTRSENDSLSRSIAIGLRRKNVMLRTYGENTKASPSADLWNRFGYELVGPVYFNFLHWLCRQTHRDNVRRLLLCARDGYPLVRGFEILKQAWGIPLNATYFYASRRLINLATVRQLDAETIEFLLMANPGLTLRDFILRLNLDPIRHEAALLNLGFKSLDAPVTHDYFGRFLHPADKVRLAQWLKGNEAELLDHLAEDAHLIEDYFQQVVVDSPETALIDIGWKATVARAVQDFARKKNPQFNLRAYFFGTFAGAERLLHSGGRVESFFTHLGTPTHRASLISVHEGLVELLFAAPHGSIIGLEKGPNGIQPVYGTCEYSLEQLAALDQMREGAYRFIAEAAALIPDYMAYTPSDEYVDRTLRQLLLHPTREQARHLGQMPYRVSYGDSNPPRQFASPRQNSNQSFSSQLQAYGHAAWKSGFLAQVSKPEGWLLQITLILSGLRAALNSGTFWKSLKWVLLRKSAL